MSAASVTFLQPKRLSFGVGCFADVAPFVAASGWRRVHVVCSPSQRKVAAQLQAELGCEATLDASVASEPTIGMFEAALVEVREARPECVVGIGGGSPLDLAKLLAAFVRGGQGIAETFGIGLLSGRACGLVCVPTTAGAGSEVSPNAVLLDEESKLKKAVISPWLVPDATFVDPELTRSMPASVTASTGLDALTHCIEAYTNRFANPLVDLYALEGVRLCARYLRRAVANGEDLEAREAMARASLYGGLCLGPVNTAAVHALAYPLGGEFHVAHGLSNAVLLPKVFRWNAEACVERHAEVAVALGVDASLGADEECAIAGADALDRLAQECGVEMDLARLGVRREDVPRMARAAMTVTRLLKNNPRELTHEDAERLYLQCFSR